MREIRAYYYVDRNRKRKNNGAKKKGIITKQKTRIRENGCDDWQ